MPKAKNLITLLQIPHGKVHQEDNVREYIKQQIPEIKQDSIGNLYIIHPNTPIICAHMDNVGSAEAQKHLHKIRIDSRGIIRGTHNMGADDKVGIFIALELYKRHPKKVSLIFTIQEETGGIGADKFDKSLIADNTYMVIPDRYGRSDVIASHNDYCTDEFENEVMIHLGKFSFKSAIGVRCDADKFNENINCINISCGYMKHHTDQEYVVWTDTVNTIQALTHLIEQNISKMQPPEPYKYMYDYSRFGGVGSSYFGMYQDINYNNGTEVFDGMTYEATGEFVSATKPGKMVNIYTGQTIDIQQGDRELYLPENNTTRLEDVALGFNDDYA